MSDFAGRGLLTTKSRPVVIFDLDGTLIAGNSFHRLIRLLITDRTASQAQISARLTILFLTCLRLMRILPREYFKRAIQSRLNSRSELDHIDCAIVALVGHLKCAGRPEILEALRISKALQCTTILATGALAEYAVPYAAHLEFDAVVATEYSEHEWRENIRSVKRNRTLQIIEQMKLSSARLILIADTSDDWPLADACDVRFWLKEEAIREDSGNDHRYTLDEFRQALTLKSNPDSLF